MKRVEFLGMLLLLAVLHSGFADAAGSNGQYVADAETGPVPAPIGASDGPATASDARPVTETAGEPIAVEVRRNVVINGQRLSDAELASVERTYRIRIADANYWYDLSTGAWGAQGGPTLGFIAPGLTLGGTLQPDASGGGTGVFVNGRELHPYDLAQLQQMTGPIAPGRYFITAQGLAGYEGGEPAYDLNALATLGQSGSSSSWKKRLTLASGLSGGGIVSTGN